MATTINQSEAIPTSYPTENSDHVWQRLEAYVAHRWTEREVIWIVEGPGDWVPPLTPTTITQVEKWTGTAWEVVESISAPQGYSLAYEGPYRFTADVGGGDVPACVTEAFTRLNYYLTDIDSNQIPVGNKSYSINMGEISEQHQRDPAAIGKAMQNSGAADLLRHYRRV